MSAAPDSDGARRIGKLERINAALMAHVERSMDQQGSAYSLFQTAIMLEGRVRSRTEELTGLMHSLERSNAALVAAKEEAETANRSKTRFLAAASHDLLQPLNAARLSASALADMPLTPDARAISGQIERGLQTIEDLIKTLLDISKLDAGVVRPVIRPVRLSDLLAGIAASFQRSAAGKGLRLHVRGPDRVVASDPVMLGRIVQNLVSNALRYTSSGGVLIAVRMRGAAARIEVIDTGCGIVPAERALVFEEFYRGAAETMDSEPGLGLGLAIVQRMATALFHPLTLASRPGHGRRPRPPPAHLGRRGCRGARSRRGAGGRSGAGPAHPRLPPRQRRLRPRRRRAFSPSDRAARARHRHHRRPRGRDRGRSRGNGGRPRPQADPAGGIAGPAHRPAGARGVFLGSGRLLDGRA